jgi:hypothetical protein
MSVRWVHRPFSNQTPEVNLGRKEAQKEDKDFSHKRHRSHKNVVMRE